MDAVEVCRLSCSAASEDSEVISATKRDQSTREVIATSGKITNTRPEPRREVDPARQPASQLGSPGTVCTALTVRACAKPASARTCWPSAR